MKINSKRLSIFIMTFFVTLVNQEYFAKRRDIHSCPENYSSEETLRSSPKNLFRDEYFGDSSRCRDDVVTISSRFVDDSSRFVTTS